MIKIIAETRVPQENYEAFATLAAPLVAASQKEPGNIFYHMHRSRMNPEKVVFMEGWEDQKAIDRHNASPHFTSVLPELGRLSSAEMAIETFDVIL